MYELFDISYNEVGIIKELWEKNRQYHEDISERFGYQYRLVTFADRMKGLAGFNEDMIKITVVKENDEYIGYCISIITQGKGELESLHVSASKRGQGIGRELVAAHIDWMKKNKCDVIGVTASQENSNTIDFYKSLGFYPKTVYMQLL